MTDQELKNKVIERLNVCTTALEALKTEINENVEIFEEIDQERLDALLKDEDIKPLVEKAQELGKELKGSL